MRAKYTRPVKTVNGCLFLNLRSSLPSDARIASTVARLSDAVPATTVSASAEKIVVRGI
jgi:hypothetical protein